MDIARFTDRYFLNAQSACRQAGENPRVLYQVFQRGHSIFCGVKYVRTLLEPLSDVTVESLRDGDSIAPLESVLHIAGPVIELLPYETIYLGLLARMTRIATNVRAAVEAANGKPVLFFPARFDVPEVQEYDEYAAIIGGAAGASTASGADAYHKAAVGTMPHALIAAFRGNTVAAALALAEACPDEPIWALVDFENDSARTSVECFKAFRERGLKLAGVRLDTSQTLVDEGLQREGIHDQHGVTPEVVRIVRRELDAADGRSVRIAVSGGFTAEKIRTFETEKVPADVYAVGESFLRGSIPFTSDIVGFWENEEFVPSAKIGRGLLPNPRLRKWK